MDMKIRAQAERAEYTQRELVDSYITMDAAFQLEEPLRSELFRSLMQSLGGVYVCLWSYIPQPSNCLISLDGYYSEAGDQTSTPSASAVARRLFDEYRQRIIPIDNDRIPGIAFMNNRPYIEMRSPEIARLAFDDIQRLFYQESGIQTTVFMGCRSGEIELGLPYTATQINIEMGLREWFPEDFMRQPSIPPDYPSQPAEQNQPPSSSSSSLRSLDSPVSEYSPLKFPGINPSTQQMTAEMHQQPAANQEAFLTQIRSLGSIPTREREDEAMTKAILAVLSSPSSASSASFSSMQQHRQRYDIHSRASAFKGYSAKRVATGPEALSSLRSQSLARRAISYYHRLRASRLGQNVLMGMRPTSSQSLHHMISERKRREKLNESFQALRSLLPQGTKKDKASVLSSAREQLAQLKAQVAELIQKNQTLQSQKEVGQDQESDAISFSGRFDIRIRHLSESTSGDRMVDLGVTVRGECESIVLLIRLLEFLKGINNVSLVSLEARTQIAEASTPSSHSSFRLRIEGGWDESAFLEAVRRIVGDVAK